MSIRYENNLNLARLRSPITERGMKTAIEHVAEVSAQEVPIEEGTLLRSQRTGVTFARLRAWLSYSTVYARYQHEKLTLKHEHGNAKFLELPLFREAGNALKIIAHDIKLAIHR